MTISNIERDEYGTATASVLTTCGVRFYAMAKANEIVMTVELTSCCRTDVKAVQNWDGAEEIVCRGCYEPRPEDRFLTSGYSAILEGVKAANCPVPDSCADHVQFQIEQALTNIGELA